MLEKITKLFKLQVPQFSMKVMRVSDKKIGKMEYYKYRVTLPKEVVRKSQLMGKDLKARAENGKIIIEQLK